MRPVLSTWYPLVLFAAVIFIGVPLWCWFAPDDDPANEIAQEQEGQSPRPAEMSPATWPAVFISLPSAMHNGPVRL